MLAVFACAVAVAGDAATGFDLSFGGESAVACPTQPNPKRHQPHQAPHSSPARPKTRRPAHTHQPSGHPAPNADPTNPSVDSG